MEILLLDDFLLDVALVLLKYLQVVQDVSLLLFDCVYLAQLLSVAFLEGMVPLVDMIERGL